MNFFTPKPGGYRTSVSNILRAKRFLDANPSGQIVTGIWTDETWDRETFNRWFSRCLAERINRNDCYNWRKLDGEYQVLLRRDCRIINEYFNRVRHPGSTCLLSTPEMKRRYPHIDCQWEFEARLLPVQQHQVVRFTPTLCLARDGQIETLVSKGGAL